jgi:hypothetical protein
VDAPLWAGGPPRSILAAFGVLPPRNFPVSSPRLEDAVARLGYKPARATVDRWRRLARQVSPRLGAEAAKPADTAN